MNKDDIVKGATNAAPSINPINPVMPPQLEVQPSTTEGALTRLEQKLDKVIEMLSSEEEGLPKKAELPF